MKPKITDELSYREYRAAYAKWIKSEEWTFGYFYKDGKFHSVNRIRQLLSGTE